MTQTVEERNKAFRVRGFETLFNKKDSAAAERFCSPTNIQHGAHIPPGRIKRSWEASGREQARSYEIVISQAPLTSRIVTRLMAPNRAGDL